MGNYDEFDLDIKKEKANGNVSPRATAGLVCSIVIGSVVTGCTGGCVTTNCTQGCSNGCSQSTCTCGCSL